MKSRTHPRFNHSLPLCLFAFMAMELGCLPLRAQETQQTANADGPKQNRAAANDRNVSWRTLPRNFLHDQKDVWLFPTQLVRGRHWLPAVAVTGVTAGLIAADPHDTPYFRRTSRFEGFNDAFSGRITASEIALVPLAFLVGGHLRRDPYAEKTALLAGEAFADSATVDVALNVMTRRLRPSDLPPSGSFSDTFFRSHKSPIGINTSFPSGHAAEAFAVAAVFSHRYRRHRWVPWVAYGTATVISFSRVTLQSHFPSDVFLGAALGYSITKFAVLRPR